METYTINAAGKKLGRVATEAAHALMGKHRPDFRKNLEAGVRVVVERAGALSIDPKKKKQKTYHSFSGYPSGLKTTTLARVLEKKGVGPIIAHAVRGMLPANKLRTRLLKQLIITE